MTFGPFQEGAFQTDDIIGRASYNTPTLAELRSRVWSDLRDTEDDHVFASALIDAFINEGIAELNRARPLEVKLSIADMETLDENLGLDYVWRVELTDIESGANMLIPNTNSDSGWRTGWDLFAGKLTVGQLWGRRVESGFEASTHSLTIWGYRGRDMLVADEQIAELDFDGEFIVRRLARVSGLRTLNGDRSLFQQWQALDTNSDVSETQLTGLLNAEDSMAQRLLRRSYAIRRPVD